MTLNEEWNAAVAEGALNFYYHPNFESVHSTSSGSKRGVSQSIQSTDPAKRKHAH